MTRNGLALALSLALCLTGCAASGRTRDDAFLKTPASGAFPAEPPVLDEDTGSCRPLLRHLELERDEHKDVRHSCWNRVWEVPTAVVVYPAVAVIMIGAITSPIWVPLIFLF